jgi:uncharacterized membrane protein YhaH (DUF805 family)
MDWIHLFFSFNGRISRQPFWIASCILIAISIVLAVFFYSIDRRPLGGVLDLAVLYPNFAVIFKRAHDRDMAIWIPSLALILSILLTFIEILGLDGPFDDPSRLYFVVALPTLAVALYLLVDLGFRRGTHGPNRHGPDPLEGRT